MLNKVLKGIILFVLLSIGYAVFIGVTNKQNEIVTEVEIDAPPGIVYEYITDFEKSKQWIDRLETIEKVSGEDLAVGSRYDLTFSEGKRDMVIHETLTVVRENERFAFEVEDEFLTGTVDITLTPTEEGTLVREVNTFTGNTFVARMMLGMAKRSIKRGKQDMYNKLEDICEAAADH